MSMTETASFVRKEFTPQQPAPASEHGVWGWMRKNLLSSPINVLLTLVGIFLIYILITPLIKFAFVNSIWEGKDRSACAIEHVGACWAMVKAKFTQYIYFQYPADERWRVDLAMWSGLALLVPLLIPAVPLKSLNAVSFLVFYPIAALILLTGGHIETGSFLEFGSAIPASEWSDPDVPEYLGLGEIILGGESVWAFLFDWVIVSLIVAGIVLALGSVMGITAMPIAAALLAALLAFGAIRAVLGMDFGLEPVDTPLWGGLMVTLIIAVTAIVASLPLGVLLALGRRSDMPLIRSVCIVFIEFWRGIPLITVLFMSSVMLPLFLPEGVTFDKLLRALIGVTLFASAYMAETVRGGLQAIPKGQYEGAQALGLGYWQMMNLIVLPQAIKHVIPGIVNVFIGLFKDTTLVLIIGMFDLLGAIQQSFTDSKWASETQDETGYLFAAVIFWIFCFAMSRYSIFMENRLHTGHKR